MHITSKPIPTIREQLLVLVAACVLPAVVLTTVLIYLSYSSERAIVEQTTIVTARALMQAVDRDLENAQGALQALATSPSLASGDIPGFYGQATEALRYQRGNNLVLSDVHGQQLMNTLSPLGVPLPRHANPAQIRRVLDTARPVISDLYVGGVTRRPLIGIDVPVTRDNQVRYVLTMGFLPERLGEVLTRQNLPSDWVVSIFDSTGVILARTHEPQRFIGQKGAPALVQRMAEVAEGVVETDTLEGIPVAAAFSRSAVSNWAVAIGVPKSVLMGGLWKSVSWTVAGAAISLISGFLVATVVGNRIARSIRGLVAPATALGSGDPVELPTRYLRETNDVGEALLRASDLLQERTRLSYFDSLTGLANRPRLLEEIERQIMAARRYGRHLAVVYLDLDHFKQVNDSLGHEAGDELLKAVAGRLKSSIRETDTAARLGGDEFVVLLPGLKTAEEVRVVTDTLRAECAKPTRVAGREMAIGITMGVSFFPDDAQDVHTLLRYADLALYRAKVDGRNTVRFYSPELV